MLKKPIEMEAQIAIKPNTGGVLPSEFTLNAGALITAQKQIDDGAALQFPAYRFVSQRIYTSGKLAHVARTYKYSPLLAAKVWLLEKLGRRKQADPIRHFGG